jgi:uncharacterized protein (DUF486 family)
VGLLIVGIIVIFIGLAVFFGTLSMFWQYFWPFVIVLIGIWLITRGLIRRNRYGKSSTQ